MQGLQSWITVL